MTTSRPIHRLLGTLLAVGLLTAGCATATPDLGPQADEPPVVAGDPDLDTGDDANGGVLDAPQDDDDEVVGPEEPGSDAAEPAPVTAAPTAKPSSNPTVAKPVAKPAAKPAAKPVAKPAPTKSAPKPAPTKPAPKPAALADGTYEGRLVTISRTSVTLDLVRILSGQEAIDAAKADGHPLDDDGTLPNDVYVKDLKKRVTVPVAGDGGFQVYDCSAGCVLVGTTLEALASGTTVPYGGPNAHMTLRVDHGEVVSLVEVYLP